MLTTSDWSFHEAALIQEMNSTVIRTKNEGLLIVNFANKQSGEKMNVTVCPGNFNWYTANPFVATLEMNKECGTANQIT